VRVLDLTRVIAGPVCGRTLAAYGAEVLLITNPHLADAPAITMGTGFGKRSASLDLQRPDNAARLRHLVRESDVLSQSYRPGTLARQGFRPEDVARLRPGIVYVTLCAYSHAGPWRERRGFETLIQTVSGMAHEYGLAQGLDRPQHLPSPQPRSSTTAPAIWRPSAPCSPSRAARAKAAAISSVSPWPRPAAG